VGKKQYQRNFKRTAVLAERTELLSCWKPERTGRPIKNTRDSQVGAGRRWAEYREMEAGKSVLEAGGATGTWLEETVSQQAREALGGGADRVF